MQDRCAAGNPIDKEGVRTTNNRIRPPQILSISEKGVPSYRCRLPYTGDGTCAYDISLATRGAELVQ